MNRQEIYAYIKGHDGMAERIKREFGKNYTLCDNAALEAYIDRCHILATGRALDDPMVERKSVIGKLVTVLGNKRMLIKAEIDYILGKCRRPATGEESVARKLVTVLESKRILVKAEADYILGK